MLVTLRLSQSDVAYLVNVLCEYKEGSQYGDPRTPAQALDLADALQEELDQVRSIQDDIDSSINDGE